MNTDITRTNEIVEAVGEWLHGAGVEVEVERDRLSRPADDDRPFELLVLSLTGPEGSPVQKMAERHGVGGRLLVRWLLPIREEGGACSVVDLARMGRDGDKKWTFPMLFRMRAFDKNRGGAPIEGEDGKGATSVHPLNLPPDLEADGSAVYPAWWRDVGLAWKGFAKKLKELEEQGRSLTPHDFAKLEARLNAVFVSSRARRGARCFEDESGGSETNPLRALEDRRNVLIDWPAQSLGRLRVPHASHRGKLCPFQTPESKLIGLSLHLAADARVSPDGTIARGKRKDLLSAAVGLVPYPIHTDGPRLMMGGKNMKQAEIGIAGAEPPLTPGYYEGEKMLDSEARRQTFEGRLDEDNRFIPYLGLNALTVIMPFEGYTYEDGLVISESLAKRLFIEEGHYSYSKRVKDVVFDKNELEARGLTTEAALEEYFKERGFKPNSPLGGEGILDEHRFVYGDKLLPHKAGKDKHSLKLLLGNGFGEELDISDIYAHHAPGVLRRIDVEFNIIDHDAWNVPHLDLIITWSFVVQRFMSMGDKLTGRNGNKGVVTQVLPDKDMPQIHFKENGNDKTLPAELIISPSSIMGRKNLGQIWEMTHSLMIRLGGEALARELEEELDLKLKDEPIDALSWERIRPILEGFGADGRGTFEITGDGIPEGARAFAGWQYFCRLHHHAWKKLQARGAHAPRDWATGQPMTCGARTGQRMGEMENWSLLSHGALEALMAMREFHTGDFSQTRDLLSAILLSLGVQSVAGEGAGLEFAPRLKEGAEAKSLQWILSEEHGEPYPAYRACWYINPSEVTKKRPSLREEAEKSLKKYKDDEGDANSRARIEERVQALLDAPGFFDEGGALHVETLLLDCNPDLKRALREFYQGAGPYRRLWGLVRYHDGLVKMLSGKTGVPRRYLLGRRYDHSGRAVIVPEPSLAPHEAALPIAMLVELFDGYDKGYLRKLDRGLRNTEKLRAIVNDIPKRREEAEELARKMDEHLTEHPLWAFLVRQPSLHRHSVQAFRLRCWEHPVIGMPPMTTSGFNADFDGDTMAVFLPPYEQAADLGRFSILENPGSVGTGKPAFADGLDLALGWWALKGKEQGETLSKHLPEFLQYIGPVIFEARGDELLELQLDICQASTGAATLAPGDFEALCEALKDVPKPEDLKTEGKEETERAKAILEAALKADPKNGLALMIRSGAKGKAEDALQMTWALGKIDKMKDHELEEGEEETEPVFIQGNYWRGITEDELFAYSYPSRYSMAQKKLSVAEAGYLSRQLAEGLYELNVSGEDCGATEGLRVAYDAKTGRLTVQGEALPALGDMARDLDRVAWGRSPLGLDFCLTEEHLKFIEECWESGGKPSAKNPEQEALLEHLRANKKALVLRSPLYCKAGKSGHICRLCCGADLATKPYDCPEPVDEGYAAGLTAAQAIGERGTQLAMKRFHDVSHASASPIQGMRRLLIHGKAEDRTPQGLLWELFNKVLRVPPPEEGKGQDCQEELKANGELPQALIHYELALTPLLYTDGGLDAAASAKEERFLSALAHESAGKVIRFDGSTKFEDDLSTVKSRLMWEGGRR